MLGSARREIEERERSLTHTHTQTYTLTHNVCYVSLCRDLKFFIFLIKRTLKREKKGEFLRNWHKKFQFHCCADGIFSFWILNFAFFFFFFFFFFFWKVIFEIKQKLIFFLWVLFRRDTNFFFGNKKNNSKIRYM